MLSSRQIEIFRAIMIAKTVSGVHMTMSALAFYNISNRYTFQCIFDWDMESPAAIAERRAVVIETLLRYCAV